MSRTTTVQARLGQMTIVPEHYDRTPLTVLEKQALATAVHAGHGANALHYDKQELMRFQQPIYDVIDLRTAEAEKHRKIRRLLYQAMVQRGTSLWEWSKEEWIELLCSNHRIYTRSYGPNMGRSSLMDMAYLLGGITDLREVGQKRDCWDTARAIFSAEVIDQEMKRVTDLLVGQQGQGYVGRRSMQCLTQAFGMLFLLNRSPYLEHLSPALLQTAGQGTDPLSPYLLEKIHAVLQQLGLFPLAKKQVLSSVEHTDITGIAGAWAAWCKAWFKRHPKPVKRIRAYYHILLGVGRWLADRHPAITSPQHWDEELALDYVRYLCSTATVGDYTCAQGLKSLVKQGRVGNPLTPRTIQNKLAALIRFFCDVQSKPHQVGEEAARTIAKRFDPLEAFRLPSSVKQLIQPDPRDIDEVMWCKLTYAAATLTAADYSVAHSGYPLSYYRAAALLWVTSARRPNEIMRLQVECLRRDWDPQMLDEDGIPLSGQEAQLCYLHIPANKTKGPYWVPIPKYAVDAIELWKRERPANQPKMIDSKDNALVDFLFCLRGQKMGEAFLNASLIPVLCKRAGMPEKDARGTITGHRARSTIATMLRRNGLSLDDIADFLGHTNPNMVRAYARTDQFRFGREMNRANDLMRIVEGIIDTRAARAGKPTVFFFLGRGVDGQPRFCGNPAWDKCAHRLACLKCPMYVGSDQASRLAERLDVRDELFKFQTQVEMTSQEKAAVEGDMETLTALITADAAVAPPEPPNDQFRFNTLAAEPNKAQADLVALGRELATLTQDLAAAERRTDGRNARVRALKTRIAAVTEQMRALDQITSLTKPTLGT